MSFEQSKEVFDRDGFVVVRQLLSPTGFGELCANLDRYIREVVPTLSDRYAFYQDRAMPETLKQLQYMAEIDPFFRDYHQHPTWVALARALLGAAIETQETDWFDKPPGAKHPTPPHQDNYYFNLVPDRAVTMWMALDPVDGENGCVRYLPGSHRTGLREHDASNVLAFSQGITDFHPDEAAN